MDALPADSSFVVISAIDKFGVSSSSVIVKIAELSVIVEFVALERRILAVSLFSSSASESVETEKFFDVSPSANVSVPDVAT